MSYVQERLSFFPWMLIPVFIYYLGNASDAAFDGMLFVLVLEFVLFLRVLDDYACFDYDRRQGKDRPYLQRGRKGLLLSMLPLGALLALVGYLAVPVPQLTQVAIFLGLHIPVYMVLRGKPAILAVSLRSTLSFSTWSLRKPSKISGGGRWPALYSLSCVKPWKRSQACAAGAQKSSSPLAWCWPSI